MWQEVSKNNPCPICGKPDWCSVSHDGMMAACRRVDVDGKHKIDRQGQDYWIHQVSDKPIDDNTELPDPAISKADTYTLDKVYAEILSILSLSPDHHAKLLTRGLTDAEINARQYRTLPLQGRGEVAQKLIDKFGATTCQTIPGLYMKESTTGSYWTLGGAAGIVIPCRNVADQIIALKIRADETTAEYPKYSYVSSVSHGGPGPGCVIHWPYALEPWRDDHTIRITEGELKADIAQGLTGMRTISTPGATSWRAAIKAIESNPAIKNIYLALDADSDHNAHVAQALHAATLEIQALGYNVFIETWPAEWGKGIDDILAAGHMPEVKTAPKVTPQDINPENVYSHIAILAAWKKSDPQKYEDIRQSLKGKINLQDLNRAIKEFQLSSSKLKVVDENTPAPTLADMLPAIPNTEIKKPYQWNVTPEGVFCDTDKGPVCACPCPVIITKRLHDYESGEERIELGFYRDQKWQYLTADRSIVFSHNAIMSLADKKGFPVYSTSARHLVKYFADLERANMDTLPIVRSTHHMGWNGRNFIPGAEGELVLDVDEGGMAALAAGYRPEGELDMWVNRATGLRGYKLARFGMAASFAAPLLKLIGERVFIVHFYGDSRGGKTAGLKLAQSIWGDPETITATFNATKVGLERQAALYSDLPLGIDERQVQGGANRQDFVESLIYMLGLGRSKTRGSKGGGLQTAGSWRTIVLSTGEEALSDSSSMAGIKTRVLELYGKVVPDETAARDLHWWTREQHGTAGPEFLHRLLDLLDQYPDRVASDHKLIFDLVKKQWGHCIGAHMSFLATVGLGDYYSSMWIFGQDQKTAFTGMMDLITYVANQLETAQETEDAYRAHDYLESWIDVNRSGFSTEGILRERYGFFGSDDSANWGWCYMYPTVFDRALDEGGFNSNRVRRDWMQRKWLRPDKDGRSTVRCYDQAAGKQSRFICFKLILDDGEGAEIVAGQQLPFEEI